MATTTVGQQIAMLIGISLATIQAIAPGGEVPSRERRFERRNPTSREVSMRRATFPAPLELTGDDRVPRGGDAVASGSARA